VHPLDDVAHALFEGRPLTRSDAALAAIQWTRRWCATPSGCGRVRRACSPTRRSLARQQAARLSCASDHAHPHLGVSGEHGSRDVSSVAHVHLVAPIGLREFRDQRVAIVVPTAFDASLSPDRGRVSAMLRLRCPTSHSRLCLRSRRRDSPCSNSAAAPTDLTDQHGVRPAGTADGGDDRPPRRARSARTVRVAVGLN
jgi:hypothetical protein